MSVDTEVLFTVIFLHVRVQRLTYLCDFAGQQYK
jgi:hypothetical protein